MAEQLKAQAYERLKDLLLSGRFEAPSLLSERQLAGQLGMSNTPVRSAIERLETERFIRISPQRGILVRELTNKEIAAQYEIRQRIEPYVCSKLAGRLNGAQIRRLRANLTALEKSLEKSQLQRTMKLDTQFHLLLCEFYGNEEFTHAISHLRDKISRVVLRAFASNPERLASGLREHRDIAEAIIGGNADQAEMLAMEHLRAGQRSVLPPVAWE